VYGWYFGLVKTELIEKFRGLGDVYRRMLARESCFDVDVDFDFDFVFVVLYSVGE